MNAVAFQDCQLTNIVQNILMLYEDSQETSIQLKKHFKIGEQKYLLYLR